MGRGFRLAGVSLSFASPKESKQRKGDPWVGVGLRPIPCATRRAGRLAKLAFGSNNASRLPPARLRCSAPLKGPERRPGSASKTKNSLLRSTAKNGQKSNSLRHRFSTGRLSGPLERCRATQAGADQGRALSEGEARVAQPPRQPSSAGYRRSRHRPRGGLFFGYFLLATQKKVRPPARRNPMPIKAACMSTKEPSKC